MLTETGAGPTISADIMGRTVSAPAAEIVQRLTRINAALVERLENRIDQQASAYSLFQTAIGLEAQVRKRTAELKTALVALERSNEALVSAKETAEKANSSKTRFLAAAGHDLLQPLYAAQLSISTLAEAQTSKETEALCRQIDRALVTIEAYLRSILDISKLDAGVVTPEVQNVPLSEIFQSLDSDFRPIVERKKLKLRFRPTSLCVATDQILLRRVLQNLVSNAVRYTSAGGVLIGARRRGDEVRIEVTDTGVGIDPSEFERVFEEFHRSPSIAGQHSDGLGLGLSIVQRMTQALDHRVELRSRLARGSRFAIVAPLAEQTQPHSAETVLVENWARASDLTGRRILLIENDPDVLEATRWLLVQWGAEVVAARDGATVQALLTGMSRGPDAIIADYHLDREETGVQAITLARKIARRDIPAVVVTADQGAETIDISRAAGCEVLRKPVKPAQLRAVLTHVL